jgi:hypothetical protein
LQASTTPTLGRLHPLSTNFFVSPAGDVGIGTTAPATKLEVAGTARVSGFELTTGAAAGRVLTSDGSGTGTWLAPPGVGGSGTTGTLARFTAGAAIGDSVLVEDGSGNVGVGTASPAARLEVAGTARVTDTLTLAPAGDTALDVSTGSIYKGGALFLHTRGGADNTGLGDGALASVTTGFGNTALGERALRSTTTSNRNTACGYLALFSNGAGNVNTAVGVKALYANTSGFRNTAAGFEALPANTTGSRNTACGDRALASNTTGSDNIAIGHYAGSALTTGGNNIAIGSAGIVGEATTIRIGTAGTHTRAFLAGVRGVTTNVADAIPVLVDSSGQLGTISSSRRFKEEIRDMGELSERLLALRPVVFRYKPEVQSGERPLEYGLIAEEVAEVFPELVVRDEEGQPFTVKYHLLSSMLLNELQKTREELQGLVDRIVALEQRGAPATVDVGH